MEKSPLELAQERLAAAALKQPMHPAGAAISSYVNGMLQSARIDALIEVIANPPLNASWTMQDAIDAAIVRHLNRKAEELESQALRQSIAQGASEGRSLLAMPN